MRAGHVTDDTECEEWEFTGPCTYFSGSCRRPAQRTCIDQHLDWFVILELLQLSFKISH